MAHDPTTGRVLIVDDQPANLNALEAVLQQLNVEVVRAFSGRAALRSVMTEQFDLILLDVCMPEMDGFDTADAMKAYVGDTPICLGSAGNGVRPV